MCFNKSSTLSCCLISGSHLESDSKRNASRFTPPIRKLPVRFKATLEADTRRPTSFASQLSLSCHEAPTLSSPCLGRESCPPWATCARACRYRSCGKVPSKPRRKPTNSTDIVVKSSLFYPYSVAIISSSSSHLCPVHRCFPLLRGVVHVYGPPAAGGLAVQEASVEPQLLMRRHRMRQPRHQM